MGLVQAARSILSKWRSDRNSDGPRILVIDAHTPTPDRDSGSLDMANALRLFRRLCYRVSYASTARFARPGPDSDALRRIGIETLHPRNDKDFRRLLKRRGRQFDAVLISRLPTAIRYFDDVRLFCPQARVVFNTVDLHFLREQRQAQLEGSQEAMARAERSRLAELDIAARSDATIVISHAEADLLARQVPSARVVIIPLIRDVPPRTAVFPGRRGVLFVGGFLHSPNLDAARFLLDCIWPSVRSRLPGCCLHIAGSDTPPELFARASEDVVIHGHVPDLAPLFERCRVSAAPLRYGAGLKGKVATSLGFGVPCVTTSIGVEGSGLRQGEEVLVEDDPAAFAEALVRVHEDAGTWERLSVAGHRFVERSWSLDANLLRYQALFQRLGVPTSGWHGQA